MAWGYEKSFTVEHDDTVRKKLNCRDCMNYDSSDRSCMKRPFYMPEDGYGHWKNCRYFELDTQTSNYEYKLMQYKDHIRRKQARKVMAIDKWREDIEWISNYRVGTFKEVVIRRILSNR